MFYNLIFFLVTLCLYAYTAKFLHSCYDMGFEAILKNNNAKSLYMVYGGQKFLYNNKP